MEKPLLHFGLGLLAVAAGVFLALVLTGIAGPGRPAAFVSLRSSRSTVFALASHARHAGSASALLGTLQVGLGSISGIAMGLMSVSSLVPMACIIVCGAVGILCADAARPKRAG